MDEGTAIGTFSLLVYALGPILLAVIIGYAIMRSRRRAKQGPLAPGEPDPTSGRAAPTRRP
jgi:hypothetical protein